MANVFFNPAFKNSINQRFREKRFKFFITLLEKIKSDKPIRILDIGGTEIYWERMDFIDIDNIFITLLNLEKEKIANKNFKSIKGNACDLSVFKDKEFDIVFSNSVIEHLFCEENQIKMAQEVRRVGKYYYVQTPNKYFPIEPHWMFPFFQFLPINTRIFLTRKFNLGHYKKAKNKEAASQIVKEVKLLSKKEMQQLFPDGKIYKELFLGITKSITLYRFPSTKIL